jgi:hypothetical protein
MMRNVLAPALALSLSAAFAFGGPPESGLKSIRAPLVADAPVVVDLQQGGIRVASYLIDLASVATHPGPGPAMTLQVKNAGSVAADVSVAAALFDKEENLVGAATASHPGSLEPGASATMKMVFRDVNAHLGQAATIRLSLEIR